jgi:hypothetical protein
LRCSRAVLSGTGPRRSPRRAHRDPIQISSSVRATAIVGFPAEKCGRRGRGSRPRVEIQETSEFIISEEQGHKRHKTLGFAKYCRKCSRFAVGVIAMPSKRRAAVSAPYGHAGPGRHPHPHPARSRDAEPTFAFDRGGECRDGRRLWDAELADADIRVLLSPCVPDVDPLLEPR